MTGRHTIGFISCWLQPLFISKLFCEPLPSPVKDTVRILLSQNSSSVDLLRGMDSNHRPLGYEPNELPLLLPHDIILKNYILCIYIYTNIRKKFQNTKYFFCGGDGNRTHVQIRI